MAIFSAKNLHLAFGDVALLSSAEFNIQEYDRIGLIGRNGTGKSSLLKIVACTIKADDGEIQYQNGLRTAYVAQENQFIDEDTVFSAIANYIPDHQQLQKYYDLIEHDAHNPDLHVLQNHLDALSIWDLPRRIEEIIALIGLNSTDHVKHLSGGEKKRISIATALVQQPDILLLDEPTNHLDMEGIEWLEQTLKSFKGAIVLISHDRYFLDQVCQRIIELDRAKLNTFEGNFAYYQEKKAEMLHNESVENAKFDKLLSQEEVWIRKGVEARRTRSVARIERLKDMRETYVNRREYQGNIRLEVSKADMSGKMVAELMHVHKSLGDKKILQDISLNIMRDKIGIIGNNGIGKSTLVKVLLGELPIDSGKIKLGANLQIAYFDQMREQLDMRQTLAHTISPGSEWIEINGRKKHVAAYLNDFLFSPKRAESPVMSLSGGERNRLLLARIFAKPSNILVLDEPTNDLDIQTLELLEEKLSDYKGTVLLISHDRYFLDNIVDFIIAPTSVTHKDQKGGWKMYIGGYQDWLRQINWSPTKEESIKVNNKPTQQISKNKAPKENAVNTVNVNTSVNNNTTTKNNAKLSYNEKRELEGLPEKIAIIEQEQQHIHTILEGLYSTNVNEANAQAARYGKLEEDLLHALERWTHLENKAKLNS
jgi:ABC transport system ATP-binding/permease protein